MSDLADLRRRVAEATGPDRELDIAIAQATPFPGWKIEDDGTILAYGKMDLDDSPGWWPVPGTVPDYTASVDAALALLEKVEPDCDFYVEVEQVHGGFCQYVYLGIGGALAPIREPSKGGRLYPTWKEAKDALPLAILSALLASLPDDGRVG